VYTSLKDTNNKYIKRILYLIIIVQLIHFGWLLKQVTELTNTHIYIREIEIVEVEVTIEDKIRQAFPEDPDLFVAIAKAESNLNPRAFNPEGHKGCAGSIGVFQIACLHTDNPEKLFDVDTNIEYAVLIYGRDGLKPWGAYTSGAYKRFLQ